jgi:hypothetical protein
MRNKLSTKLLSIQLRQNRRLNRSMQLTDKIIGYLVLIIEFTCTEAHPLNLRISVEELFNSVLELSLYIK